jgi:NAD(P)H-flavin reductase
MKVTQAYIERVRQVNRHYQQLELASVDESLHAIKPGQCLLARLIARDGESETWDPYLRERWWPVGITGNDTLLIERPRNVHYEPGQFVSLLGPVGEPYKFRPSLRNVLLVAYDTEPTALAIMIPLLLRNNVSVTLVLLGAARHYRTDHLPEELEVIRGGASTEADADIQTAPKADANAPQSTNTNTPQNTMQWPDMVMTLGWADQVFVVVAPDDEILRFGRVMALMQARRNVIAKNYIFGVFQSPLACGVGACYACMVRKGKEQKFICVDGPAFDLTTLKLPGVD